MCRLICKHCICLSGRMAPVVFCQCETCNSLQDTRVVIAGLRSNGWGQRLGLGSTRVLDNRDRVQEYCSHMCYVVAHHYRTLSFTRQYYLHMTTFKSPSRHPTPQEHFHLPLHRTKSCRFSSPKSRQQHQQHPSGSSD